jgi:hypothetical protein
MVDVFVKGVDDETYREFKGKAVTLGKSRQEAIEEAMKEWVAKR